MRNKLKQNILALFVLLAVGSASLSAQTSEQCYNTAPGTIGSSESCEWKDILDALPSLELRQEAVKDIDAAWNAASSTASSEIANKWYDLGYSNFAFKLEHFMTCDEMLESAIKLATKYDREDLSRERLMEMLMGCVAYSSETFDHCDPLDRFLEETHNIPFLLSNSLDNNYGKKHQAFEFDRIYADCHPEMREEIFNKWLNREIEAERKFKQDMKRAQEDPSMAETLADEWFHSSPLTSFPSPAGGLTMNIQRAFEFDRIAANNSAAVACKIAQKWSQRGGYDYSYYSEGSSLMEICKNEYPALAEMIEELHNRRFAY